MIQLGLRKKYDIKKRRIVLKKWFIKNRKTNYKDIAKNFGISEIVSKLLVNRDVIDKDSIESFMHPTYDNLHNAREMKDLEKAVGIMKKKIESNEKIMIAGDFDVDGVISIFILYTALKRCGADVVYEVPDRVEDGYGINNNIIDKAKNMGVDTVITCDNGKWLLN
jgi:single-stranded-DNA-specific exonuclease